MTKDYLITLRVSIRLLEANVIYRSLRQKKLPALHEYALGCIIPGMSAVVI